MKTMCLARTGSEADTPAESLDCSAWGTDRSHSLLEAGMARTLAEGFPVDMVSAADGVSVADSVARESVVGLVRFEEMQE